jgi:hypothetical protein
LFSSERIEDRCRDAIRTIEAEPSAWALAEACGIAKEWSMLEKKVARAANATPKEKAEVARKTKAPTTQPLSRTIAATSGSSRGGRQDDLQERVRRRAYELWECEGRPAGRDYDHWLQAEREVASTRRQHAA